MKNKVFIPKKIFNTETAEFENINSDRENWILDDNWLSDVKDIKKVNNIIIVIWYDTHTDEYGREDYQISIYKGIYN